MFPMQLRRATHKATQIIHSSRNIWTCAIAEIQQLPNQSGIIKLLCVQRRGVHGHIRGPCRERGPDSTAVRHTKLVEQVNAKLPLSNIIVLFLRSRVISQPSNQDTGPRSSILKRFPKSALNLAMNGPATPTRQQSST